MKRWHIVFDTEKCLGCYTCMLACKDEHVGNEWFPYTDRQKKKDQKWIELDRNERGAAPRVTVTYRARMCNHCSNPPCAKNAPGMVTKREDGIVLLDPRRALGDEKLVDACPFGAISWNDEVGAAQKCTFCAHLLDDGWKEPRCVQACPLRALKAIKIEDAAMEKLAKEKGLEPIVPLSVGPRVWYKNLHNYSKCMVAGEIAYQNENKEDTCAENVQVCLMKDGKETARAATNTYGEFYFYAVEPNSGKYEVEAELPGRGKVSCSVDIGTESVDTGVLYPQKAAKTTAKAK